MMYSTIIMIISNDFEDLNLLENINQMREIYFRRQLQRLLIGGFLNNYKSITYILSSNSLLP